MSVVVGYYTDNMYGIYSDSAVLIGESLARCNDKIHKHNDVLVGFVGCNREFIKLVKAMNACKSSDILTLGRNIAKVEFEDDWESIVLLVKDREILIVDDHDSYFFASPETPYFAVGAGCREAFGSMYAYRKPITAVEAACFYNPHCALPVRKIEVFK